MTSFPFKKLNKQLYQKPTTISTEDAAYWKKLRSPVLVKEFGAIDYVDFSPIEPYYFAVTCAIRVQVFNPITKLVSKNLAKFKSEAYGATFRSDGKLVVAGGEETTVKLFDVHSNKSTLLRVFTGHKAAVHRTFFTKDQTKVLSFSDDRSVGVWDIASEQLITNFSEHNDYIRAGSPSPVSPDIILSGGYDNILKLYDCRTSQSILTVNHGSPIESTLFLPSGGLFVSAGGTEIKVWDIFNGGKMLATISQHHKTVTCLRLASNNSRLLSSSLDRHVKVYDISTFQTVHNIDFPNAVLSLAISENDETLVAGMIDGIISVRTREDSKKDNREEKKLYRYTADHLPNTVDEVITKPTQEKKSKHNDLLQKMEYSKVLDFVLKEGVAVGRPEETIAVIQELLRRNVLHIALSGKNSKQITLFLKFVTQNIGVNRFMRTLIDATHTFTEIYEHEVHLLSAENIKHFKALITRMHEEINVEQQLCRLEGAFNLLLAGSHVSSQEMPPEFPNLSASVKAQNFVIDV